LAALVRRAAGLGVAELGGRALRVVGAARRADRVGRAVARVPQDLVALVAFLALVALRARALPGPLLTGDEEQGRGDAGQAADEGCQDGPARPARPARH